MRSFRSRSKDAAPVAVVLYTKPGCPLCDEMKAEIARARTRRPYALREVDIRTDRALADRFGLTVPVLEIEGRVAFEARLTAEAFEAALARAAEPA